MVYKKYTFCKKFKEESSVKNKKFVSFFLVAAALLYASTPVLAASKDSFSKTINFKAENEQENIPDFDKEIVKDGQKYTLSGVSVRTLKKTPQKEVQYLTKEVETVVGAQEEYAPPDELQDNDILYSLSHVVQEPISTPGEGQLVTCRNARADIEQYVNYYRANYEKRLDKNEVRYVAAYRAEQTVESQTSFIYERAATAKYEKDDNKIVKYIMAGAGILIFVAIVIAILYVIAKKKKKQEKK